MKSSGQHIAAATPQQSTPSRFLFGAHVSIAGGVANAPREAARLKMDTFQVFVKNQRQWRAAPLDPRDLEHWKELRRRYAFNLVVAHATYLINLAAADDALYRKSRLAFTDELRRCDLLEIPYLVIHPGAAGTQSPRRAAARVAAALNRVFRDHPELRVMPLLETTAGQGTSLGRSFVELGEILGRLDQPDRVGVCVDTCHVFAAGYDLRRVAGYDAMIDELQAHVGFDRVRCWHLNDCRGPCGARRDRHAHVGRGEIGLAGFRRILRDPRFHGLPMILETPKDKDERGREWDAVNLRRLRQMAAAVLRAESAGGTDDSNSVND